MSSWSRTIFVPLSILWAQKPVRRAAPTRAAPGSCFDGAPGSDPAPAPRRRWGAFFSGVDRALKVGERLPGAGALRGARRRPRGRLDDRAARGLRRPVRDPARDVERRPRAQLSRLRRGPPAAARGARPPRRAAARRTTTARCACSPACRRCGTPSSPATRSRRRACRAGDPAPRARRRRGCWQADQPPGRLGAAQPRAAGRLVLRAPERALSGRRRHLHGADGAAPGARRRRPRRCRRRRSRAASPGCWGCRTATAAGPASIATTTRPG